MHLRNEIFLRQFPIAPPEINIPRRCRDNPGAGVQKIQRFQRAEPGKDRKDPYDPQNYGTTDHNKGGNDTLADTPGGGSGIVHKSGQTIGKSHNRQADRAVIQYFRICIEHGQKRCSKDYKQKSKDKAESKGIQCCDPVDLHDSFFMSRAVILGDKACTGGIEGTHHIENNTVGIGRCRVSLHHHMIKTVDGSLHEQIGNGKK